MEEKGFDEKIIKAVDLDKLLFSYNKLVPRKEEEDRSFVRKLLDKLREADRNIQADFKKADEDFERTFQEIVKFFREDKK